MLPPALRLAAEQQFRTLAFPAISCGIYGYPLREAALIAVHETRRFLETARHLETAFFTCFSEDVFLAYENALVAADDAGG